MTLLKQNNNINYDRFNNNLKEEIISFCNVLLKNIDSKYLDNFYNNINSLNIIQSPYDDIHKNSYHPEDNTIYIEKETAHELIFHELFHMASSKCEGDNIYCGFVEWTAEDMIGKGLNEGYTQRLAEKYFNCDSTNVYYEEVLFAKLTELIVGEEEMSKFYFTSDLGGLIKELEKYSSLEDIMSFIETIDVINAYRMHCHTTQTDDMSLDVMVELHQEIKEFLLNAYITKIGKKLKQTQTKEELEENVLALRDYVYEIMETNIMWNTKTKEEMEVLSPDYVEEAVSAGLGIEKIKLFEK